MNRNLSPSKIIDFQNVRLAHHSCKILVLGGGTGGCSMAAKLSRKFKEKPSHVIVVEPAENHYYQPFFTLIGGGIGNVEKCRRSMKDVLPKNAQWIKDCVIEIDPKKNNIKTKNGDTVDYEILIVALGLKLNWQAVPGLVEGLDNPNSQVCSIYSPETVPKVFKAIERTRNGTAHFTYPNTPVKCAGAPQKIAYLAESYWRKQNLRDNINVVYNTSLPVIFGVKKYADALWEVCNSRDVHVNLSTNLIQVRPSENEAVFQSLDKPDKTRVEKYTLLHVTPPMTTPDVLKNNRDLTNEQGFLRVCEKTLRHDKYHNIFGIGDCTNTPNSKTMAAVASQIKVVYNNVMDYLMGKEMSQVYEGYASCPIVTGNDKCILAEFDYKLHPRETFPYNQGKESHLAFVMKKEVFPFIYWNLMLNGYWHGPEAFRKIFHPFAKIDK